MVTYVITSAKEEDSLKSRQVSVWLTTSEFFVACIVLGLEYVHSKQYIHRDIKPENIVIDQDGKDVFIIFKGYLRITDFGIARRLRPENFQETSGTPGYMAPEVMCRRNHGIAVDYFALGVIAYECMRGCVSFDILMFRDLMWVNLERKSEIIFY